MDETGERVYWTPFTTPLGTGYVASSELGVCRITVPELRREHFFAGLYDRFGAEAVRPDPLRNVDPVEQLEEYWEGRRTRFEFRLDFRGTAFQEDVWRALLEIPYGETRSYRQLAAEIGRPNGYQAVGGAVKANPLMLVVPCHRVIGRDGSLTGYAGGVDVKQWLLRHEGALLL